MDKIPMDSKQRKLYVRNRILAMKAEKQKWRVYRDFCVMPDKLLVQLRDKMAQDLDLREANRVEEFRSHKNK